jgi:hypothetical protein
MVIARVHVSVNVFSASLFPYFLRH